MKKTVLALSLITLSLVLSCGENNNNPQNPYPSPIPGSGNPNSPFAASLRVGSVQRNFTPQDSVSCLVNASYSEAVVTFSNTESGSSFSLRMQNITHSNASRWLSNGGGENILIALGGDTNQNNYQMGRNDLGNNCSVTTELSQGYLKGTFQCQRLMNRQGVTQPATGTYVCRTQTSQDWNW